MENPFQGTAQDRSLSCDFLKVKVRNRKVLRFGPFSRGSRERRRFQWRKCHKAPELVSRKAQLQVGLAASTLSVWGNRNHAGIRVWSSVEQLHRVADAQLEQGLVATVEF